MFPTRTIGCKMPTFSLYVQCSSTNHAKYTPSVSFESHRSLRAYCLALELCCVLEATAENSVLKSTGRTSRETSHHAENSPQRVYAHEPSHPPPPPYPIPSSSRAAHYFADGMRHRFLHLSARKRLAAYLKWLEDKARRRREYQRYLAALAATRGAGGRYSEQVRWWVAKEGDCLWKQREALRLWRWHVGFDVYVSFCFAQQVSIVWWEARKQ